jgi:hypothetical protein
MSATILPLKPSQTSFVCTSCGKDADAVCRHCGAAFKPIEAAKQYLKDNPSASIRKISAATGVSHGTAQNAKRGVQDCTRVSGGDDKSYPSRQKPRRAPVEPVTAQEPELVAAVTAEPLGAKTDDPSGADGVVIAGYQQTAQAEECGEYEIDFEYVRDSVTKECVENVERAVACAIDEMTDVDSPKADIATIFPALRALIDKLEAKFKAGGKE